MPQPTRRALNAINTLAAAPCRMGCMPPILLSGAANFKPDHASPCAGGHYRKACDLKDLIRVVRKARRKVYRELPVAGRGRITELDPRMSYAEMAAALARSNLGVLSRGAALALWRACHERGLSAWCYEFGFPESLTHTVTVVEIDGVLTVHDAFFNSSYPVALQGILDALRTGNAVGAKQEVRDRKIYVADWTSEPEQTVRWLESHAEAELEAIDGLRRFKLLWNPEAFAATHPDIPAVFGDLAARGYPEDLQFLMLHPVAVFDGHHEHRDASSMPLVGGRDLRSPIAELRVAQRHLEAELANSARIAASAARLEAELAEANSRAAQQRVALQAQLGALEGELAEMRRRLAAANDLKAQRDSQIAQLRAEIEDLRRHAASLEGEASAAREHAIEISHYAAPLLEELDQLRQWLAAERIRASEAEQRAIDLERKIAASLGARLRALWRRWAKRTVDPSAAKLPALRGRCCKAHRRLTIAAALAGPGLVRGGRKSRETPHHDGPGEHVVQGALMPVQQRDHQYE
jgi:hypothetical protein